MPNLGTCPSAIDQFFLIVMSGPIIRTTPRIFGKPGASLSCPHPSDAGRVCTTRGRVCDNAQRHQHPLPDRLLHEYVELLLLLLFSTNNTYPVISTFCYFLTGFAFAYGDNTTASFIGGEFFALSDLNECYIAFWVFEYAFCAVATISKWSYHQPPSHSRQS